MDFPIGSDGKESICSGEDLGSIPGLGRSPGGGHGNPLYSCLENPLDRGAWWPTVHEDSPYKNTGVSCHALIQGVFPTRDQIQVFHMQANSLPAEPQGNSKYIGVGSLSLLQGIFPIQELNWGLLHYWWVLYQLSYQGSPMLVRLCSTSFKLDFSST